MSADHVQPRRPALADDVYRIVREALLARRTHPGERINIEALARDLHMSTTPVRGALNRLAIEGLVRRVPNRGFVAASPLDLRAIAGIYDFRLMLEPGLAGRAARRASATGGGALISMCDADGLDGLIGPHWNDDALAAQDITFHSTIAQMAGNDLATEALATAFGRGVTFSLGYSHAAVRSAWEEHRLIAEAIAAHDADRAADAMRAHLRNALQRFEEAIAVDRRQHAATE